MLGWPWAVKIVDIRQQLTSEFGTIDGAIPVYRCCNLNQLADLGGLIPSSIIFYDNMLTNYNRC